MKFCRSEFLNILSIHQSNLDKKAINPVFAAVNIIANINGLKVVSTDGQRYLEYSVNGQFEEISCFINGTILYEIIKKSKSEFFEIKETFDAHKIFIDNAEFKLTRQINVSFPEWPDTYQHQISIDSQMLSSALKSVKWASSNEEARPALHGVCLDFQNNVLNLCATDCLKLAIFKIFDNYGFSGQWILGKKSVSELIKVLDDCEEKVEISFGKSICLTFQKDGKTVIWKTLVINAAFPNYEKLIQANQKEFPASFIGNAKEILDRLNRIMIISNQHQHTLALRFLEDEPSKISAENVVSEGEDILPGTYNGKKMKILFDGRFLQEMLMNINGDIVFEIIDPLSPVSVKQLENNGSLFVIAPIRPDM